jgi:5-methylcytosine-specific restriction endonuclease McrA
MRRRNRADRAPARRARYDSYLASRAWHDKRRSWYAAWLTIAGIEPRCLVCGRLWTLKAGHLHHTTYARLGDEDLSDLVPLCQADHRKLHRLLDSHTTWLRTNRATASAAIIATLRAHHLISRPSDRARARAPRDR